MSLLRRVLRRWRWFVAAALFVVLLPVVVSLAVPKQAPRILSLDQPAGSDALLSTCLPDRVPGVSDPVTQLTYALTARVESEGREYRVYQVSRKQQPEDPPFTHLVQLTKGQCRRLATNAMGDDNLYLHRLVPLPVARQLSLAQLQGAVAKAGGAKVFQDQLNQRFQKLPQGEVVPIPEEESWAFEQLQITLPSNVRIVPAAAPSGGP